MPRSRYRFGAAAALLFLMGCAAAAPPTGGSFGHAFARRGCTQEDAPALEIYLTQSPFSGTGDPAAPYVQFEVAGPPGETLAASTFALVPLQRDPAKPARIVRAQLVTSGQPPVWLSGTLSLNTAVLGKHVAGGYDLTLPDGKRLSANFVAVYSANQALCG